MGKGEGKKGNKTKKNVKAPEASSPLESGAIPKNKGGSKTQESTLPGQNGAVPNGKMGSKTSKVDQHETEDKLEDKSALGVATLILLEGEWDPQELADRGLFQTDPYKIHYDIYRFICHCVYIFMWVSAIAFVVIVFSGNRLLSANYDETLWKIVLVICFIYLLGSLSALLALKELPSLLIFTLKYMGIFSFFNIGIFTIVIFTSSNLQEIIYDEAFVKSVNSICILWWMSIISLVGTVIAINDTSKLKVNYSCFMNFVTIWGFIFCLLLIMLMSLAVICEYNVLGFEFDEFFFKIAGSICVMQVLASTSVAYVYYSQRNDQELFQLTS